MDLDRFRSTIYTNLSTWILCALTMGGTKSTMGGAGALPSIGGGGGGRAGRAALFGGGGGTFSIGSTEPGSASPTLCRSSSAKCVKYSSLSSVSEILVKLGAGKSGPVFDRPHGTRSSGVIGLGFDEAISLAQFQKCSWASFRASFRSLLSS